MGRGALPKEYICSDFQFQNRAPPPRHFLRFWSENDVDGEGPFRNQKSKIRIWRKRLFFGDALEDYPNVFLIVGQNWGNIQGVFTETVPVHLTE